VVKMRSVMKLSGHEMAVHTSWELKVVETRATLNEQVIDES
jgi:hypothetical protein